jgi:hypothetical protein
LRIIYDYICCPSNCFYFILIVIFYLISGPKRTHAPCHSTSTATGKWSAFCLFCDRVASYRLSLFCIISEWTCCTDVTKPCLANLTSPFRNSLFLYDETKNTMAPHDCALTPRQCCEVVPWPEGIGHGYPYRLRRSDDVDDKNAYPMSM